MSIQSLAAVKTQIVEDCEYERIFLDRIGKSPTIISIARSALIFNGFVGKAITDGGTILLCLRALHVVDVADCWLEIACHLDNPIALMLLFSTSNLTKS